MQANLKEGEMFDRYEALAERLKRQEDMEDVCRVLDESEAQFFTRIEDCPEAVELNLCWWSRVSLTLSMVRNQCQYGDAADISTYL
jgi:hypothetical protein